MGTLWSCNLSVSMFASWGSWGCLGNLYHQKSVTLPHVTSIYRWSRERQQGLAQAPLASLLFGSDFGSCLYHAGPSTEHIFGFLTKSYCQQACVCLADLMLIGWLEGLLWGVDALSPAALVHKLILSFFPRVSYHLLTINVYYCCNFISNSNAF